MLHPFHQLISKFWSRYLLSAVSTLFLYLFCYYFEFDIEKPAIIAIFFGISAFFNQLVSINLNRKIESFKVKIDTINSENVKNVDFEKMRLHCFYGSEKAFTVIKNIGYGNSTGASIGRELKELETILFKCKDCCKTEIHDQNKFELHWAACNGFHQECLINPKHKYHNTKEDLVNWLKSLDTFLKAKM